MNKRIVVLLSCFLLLNGCSSKIESSLIKSTENDDKISEMTVIDDIEGWDIPIDQVKNVYFRCYLNDSEKISDNLISDDDSRLLIESYNAIQNSDLYLELAEDWDLDGVGLGSIKIEMNDGSIIWLEYTPFGIVHNNGMYYPTSLQIEHYDVIRNIALKYGFKNIDWEEYTSEMGNDYKGIGSIYGKSFNVLSSSNVNEVLEFINLDKIDNYNLTFNDLIKPYEDEIELNDVIETDAMYIKVIEIKEGKVTAVAVTLK